jgi:hypothetical protein
MCNEDRLLNRSGDTAGTGIESLSLGDEELLKVISTRQSLALAKVHQVRHHSN